MKRARRKLDEKPPHIKLGDPNVDLSNVTRFLQYLELVATPVIGAMGLAAAVVLICFAAWLWCVDHRALMLAVAMLATGFGLVGAACLTGAKVKSRRRRGARAVKTPAIREPVD
jgi:hypothetical protein